MNLRRFDGSYRIGLALAVFKIFRLEHLRFRPEPEVPKHACLYKLDVHVRNKSLVQWYVVHTPYKNMHVSPRVILKALLILSCVLLACLRAGSFGRRIPDASQHLSQGCFRSTALIGRRSAASERTEGENLLLCCNTLSQYVCCLDEKYVLLPACFITGYPSWMNLPDR